VGAGFCSFGAAVLSFMAFVHLPQHVAEVSGDRMHAAAIVSASSRSRCSRPRSTEARWLADPREQRAASFEAALCAWIGRC
jgi:hypothetical protein